MAEITENQRADLRWMKILNDEFGTSLYWHTVRKRGPVAECEDLVSKGLADRFPDQSKEMQGYFITDAGRAALKAGDRG